MRTVMTTLTLLVGVVFASAQDATAKGPPQTTPGPVTTAGGPPQTTPGPVTAGGGPPQTTPGPVTPGAAGPSVPLTARAFTAGTGLIFNVVRADRVVDFEMVIGYLQSALERSTDPTVRAQARGWRVFRAAEPGPNATVLYVFFIDPAVAKADYGLGRILSDAYPEQLQDIWKLYTGALAGGGSLLNLTPVQPPPLPPFSPLPVR